MEAHSITDTVKRLNDNTAGTPSSIPNAIHDNAQKKTGARPKNTVRDRSSNVTKDKTSKSSYANAAASKILSSTNTNSASTSRNNRSSPVERHQQQKTVYPMLNSDEHGYYVHFTPMQVNPVTYSGQNMSSNMHWKLASWKLLEKIAGIVDEDVRLNLKLFAENKITVIDDQCVINFWNTVKDTPLVDLFTLTYRKIGNFSERCKECTYHSIKITDLNRDSLHDMDQICLSDSCLCLEMYISLLMDAFIKIVDTDSNEQAAEMSQMNIVRGSFVAINAKVVERGETDFTTTYLLNESSELIIDLKKIFGLIFITSSNKMNVDIQKQVNHIPMATMSLIVTQLLCETTQFDAQAKWEKSQVEIQIRSLNYARSGRALAFTSNSDGATLTNEIYRRYSRAIWLLLSLGVSGFTVPKFREDNNGVLHRDNDNGKEYRTSLILTAPALKVNSTYLRLRPATNQMQNSLYIHMIQVDGMGKISRPSRAVYAAVSRAYISTFMKQLPEEYNDSIALNVNINDIKDPRFQIDIKRGLEGDYAQSVTQHLASSFSKEGAFLSTFREELSAAVMSNGAQYEHDMVIHIQPLLLIRIDNRENQVQDIFQQKISANDVDNVLIFPKLQIPIKSILEKAYASSMRQGATVMNEWVDDEDLVVD